MQYALWYVFYKHSVQFSQNKKLNTRVQVDAGFKNKHLAGAITILWSMPHYIINLKILAIAKLLCGLPNLYSSSAITGNYINLIYKYRPKTTFTVCSILCACH